MFIIFMFVELFCTYLKNSAMKCVFYLYLWLFVYTATITIVVCSPIHLPFVVLCRQYRFYFFRLLWYITVMILLTLVVLKNVLRRPSHFTILLKLFVKTWKNISIYMLEGHRVVEVKIRKWFFITFRSRCLPEYVNKSIVEIYITRFGPLLRQQVVPNLLICLTPDTYFTR